MSYRDVIDEYETEGSWNFCFSILVIVWIVRLTPFSCGDKVLDTGVRLVCIVEFRRPNSPTHVSFLVSI